MHTAGRTGRVAARRRASARAGNGRRSAQERGSPRRRGGAQARSARKIRSAPKRAGGQSRGDPRARAPGTRRRGRSAGAREAAPERPHAGHGLQTGLNPRRSRSLQEIIDDRWRRSRFDQLGHPVPGEATGMPVESPVERAMDALRAAWRIEETRPKLAEAIGELEGMSGAIQKGAARREDDARAQRLNELEAQRLRLLNEVGALEARRADARERLLEDVRRENARKLAEGERKLEALKADIAACEERAQGARAALAEAESAYAEAEKRLTARAMETKALRFLQTPAERVPTDSALPSAGELISDVRTYLERAGVPLSHDQAVEVLAALTLSPVTVLCGPAFAPRASWRGRWPGRWGWGTASSACPTRATTKRPARSFARCWRTKRPRAGADPVGKLQRDRPRAFRDLGGVAVGTPEAAPLPGAPAAHRQRRWRAPLH